MPVVVPDMTEATGPIPDGTYPAYIQQSEALTSKSGNAMVKWEFELFGSAAVKHRRLSTHTVLKGPGSGKFRDLVKAATGEYPENNKPYDTDICHTRKVMLVLQRQRDESGNLRNSTDVRAVLPYKD